MSDAGTTTATAAATTATTTAATTWFAGLEGEALGHVQTRGWDKLDPTAAAIEAVKGHLAATQKLGVPQDQLLRVPQDAADEAGWKSVWKRLGAPETPDGYDFKTADFGDEGLTARMRDAARTAAVKFNVPKTMAEEIAKEFATAFGGHTAADAAERAAAISDEDAKLRENWGVNYDANRFVARQGAERLGVTPAEMDAMEKVVGGARLADIWRKIGQGLGEDRYVRDPGPGGREAMTKEQAQARYDELTGRFMPGRGDQSFLKRYASGDAAARREMEALHTLGASPNGR